jgi:hypothetical protein
VCALSGVATLARCQRAAVAKAVETSHPCGRCASNPRRWCRLAPAVTSAAMKCAVMLVLRAHGLQTSAMRCTCHCSIVLCSAASILRAQVARQRVLNRCNSTVFGMCTIDCVAGAARSARCCARGRILWRRHSADRCSAVARPGRLPLLCGVHAYRS